MIIYSIGKRIKNFFKVIVTNFDNKPVTKDVGLYEYDISKDTSKDGVYIVRYPNKKIKAELFYFNGKLNGLCNFYYENGRIKAREEYRDGVLEGTTKRYYPFGIIQSEELYHKGVLVRKKEYNEEGRLIKETKF
jgi:antitoxin component YwqK of YwqJK toxin-antitoxin module